jgi:hypothetical protein
MHTPEMYRPLVSSADIAVAVLLNTDACNMEFFSLQPRPFSESAVCALEVEWAPRHLHFAGVMAWTAASGIQAQLEPLPAATAASLYKGFEAYLTAFSADSNVN